MLLRIHTRRLLGSLSNLPTAGLDLARQHVLGFASGVAAMPLLTDSNVLMPNGLRTVAPRFWGKSSFRT
jgi:hypothetical protein